MGQVITVGANGSLEGLQHKSGALDLRKYGKATIDRISEIVWSTQYQMWVVVPTQGKLKGSPITMESFLSTVDNFREAMLILGSAGVRQTSLHSNDIVFQEYDEAVAFEVAFIQTCQKSGHSYLVFD